MKIKNTLLLAALLLAAACQPTTNNETQPTLLTRDSIPVSRSYGGVHNPYPSTVPSAPAAPKGCELVYMSHYSSHGSRYLDFESQCDTFRSAVQAGHDRGFLTEEGEDVYERFFSVYPQLKGRAGELTQIGQKQHAEIAERMVSNYPSLFQKGDKVVVRSTNLERTMLSMNAALNRICELRPGVDFDVDASVVEMYYLNPQSASNPLYNNPVDQIWRSDAAAWAEPLYDYAKSRIDSEAFASRLFSDVPRAASVCDLFELEKQLFYFSIDLQGCPVENVGFFDLFLDSELHELGNLEPARFYYMKGRYPSPIARGDESGEALLNDFLVKTEADLADGVSARLRFGHDGCIASMWALMDVPGWGQEVSSVEEIWTIWSTEDLPMAANIQMMFYRAKDGGLYFRYMVNEEPYVLPLEDQTALHTFEGDHIYSWSEFVERYTPVVAAAHEIMLQTPVAE